MRSRATPTRRRPGRAQPHDARSTFVQPLAPYLSLTRWSTGSCISARRPGHRQHGVPGSHGPPAATVVGATVEIRLTPRRPVSASGAQLTFGQPFAFNPSRTPWSMRPWESVRCSSKWLYGVPRSHGPAERRVKGAKVDIQLTPGRLAYGLDAAEVRVPGPSHPRELIQAHAPRHASPRSTGEEIANAAAS
jgi:hypothetical protein